MEKLGQNEIYSQLLGQHPILRTYKGEDLINEYTPLYTPPLDWRDIRSDCPNNSIALYAAHGRINNPNYNIKKVTGAVKYTVVGNPTIIDGIASNFSTSNYLRTSSNWAQINTKFDIVICARPSGGSALMCIGSGESGKMKLYFSTSKITFQTGNSSQDELAIETTFSNNLFYYIRIKRNENTTFLSYSTDGTNWQSEISGNLVYTSQSNFMRFGYNANIPSTFGGSIDLNQTYVKVNNEMWFGSQMQLISANPNIYLQSSGTQYIDTGLIGVTNFELDAQGVTATNTSQVVISRNSPDGNFFGQFYNTQKWGMNGSSVSANYTTRCQFDITFDSTGCEYTYEGTTYRVDGTASLMNNFYLYRANSSNPYVASCKIFSCKAYQNDTLVQHLVPVPQGLEIGNFTVPSNGMFDIVNQQFYGNAGTGDFTYGNDSPETITYDNLGFTATCTGGYKVFIDGNQYGGIRTSGSQCNIIWSRSGINTGNNIITPSALKAHKIWIEPVINGNNITVFHCARVAASGNEQQGTLWVHFNLSNVINISSLLNNDSNNLSGSLCEAVTAKSDKITCSGAYCSFKQAFDLGYVPILEADSSGPKNLYQLLQYNSKLKDVTLKNFRNKNDTTGGVSYGMFQGSNIENIKGNWICTPCSEMFYNCKKLKKLPLIDASQSKVMKDFLTNAIALEDTVLDVRDAIGLKKIGCYGTSQYFMSGFKGLQVSNQAPFNDATPPQINVSYTGMDRSALVQLFNDLPYNVGYNVVGSPTINNGIISGFSENDYVATSGTIEAQDISELVVKVRINSSALGKQEWQGILLSNFFINFYCGDNALEYAQIYFNGMEGLSFNTLLQPNTDYWLKYQNNGIIATASYSTNGINFIEGESKDPSLISTQVPNIVIYGTRYAQVFDGSIDFSNNNTYIKKNGVYWFIGQPAMTKTLSCVGATGNQNKLTIVGSPTIQDSVVSGFSSSNYLELPSWKDEGNDIDMVISFMLPNSYPNYSRALNSFGNSANNTSYFSILAYKGGLAFRINNNESISINYSLQNNILYKARLTRISGTYTLFLLDENETVLGTSSLQSSFLLANGESAIMKIGYENRILGAEFPGNIYLDNTYIKVNNELWFGREQYLLPEDKAIATNKGWTLSN